MQVIYVINEESFYMTMAAYSLQSLRKYNPDIPVLIYFIEDDCKDSRIITNKDAIAKHIKLIDKNQFYDICNNLNVTLSIYKTLDLKEEKGYFSAQRIVFGDCDIERVLLIDADTFIFDDITMLFDFYKDCDLVATTNTFGDYYPFTWKNKTIKSLNSGVVIFNNFLIKKYGDLVYDYCIQLKNKIHPLSDWLYKVSQGGGGREELAFNLFALDYDLNYRYFDTKHVEKENYRGYTKIFHTLSHNWINFYTSNRHFLSQYDPRNKKIKVPKKTLFKKSLRNQQDAGINT